MPIRKINKSWWVDFQINGKRYRKRSPVNNRDGAVEYEAFLRQKIARAEPLDNPEEKVIIPTFEEFAWKWFEIYVKNNNKPSEIRMKLYILKAHLAPNFGKFPLNKIDNLKIEEYKSKKVKEGRLALKTINNHLTVLAKCLKTAEEWIGLESIPKIKKFKIPPQKYDFLSQDESRLLLSHARGVWYDMILVALKTGLRLGEVTGLNWSDINFKNKILTVNRALFRDIIVSPKSNKERHVPLTDEVCSALSNRRQTGKFVFVDENSQFLKAERCRRTLHRICKSADLRRAGWHTLRHTFASHLVEAGASIKAIQELLGHSDIQTTMRYAHLSPSALKDTINLLEPSGISINLCPYSVNEDQKLTKIPKITAQNNPNILANKSKKQDFRPAFA